MIGLGFKKVDGRYYKYDNNPNYIEFPTGPVSLGNEFPKKFDELKTHVGTLILLTPTDCIKDRMCAFVYHGGRECYYQAIAVANLNKIDLPNLTKWSKQESKEMKQGIKNLIEDLKLISKDHFTYEDILHYLGKKATNLYLDLANDNDIETLKDDLFDDYVLRQLLSINDDSQYYAKFDMFLKSQKVIS